MDLWLAHLLLEQYTTCCILQCAYFFLRSAVVLPPVRTSPVHKLDCGRLVDEHLLFQRACRILPLRSRLPHASASASASNSNSTASTSPASSLFSLGRGSVGDGAEDGLQLLLRALEAGRHHLRQGRGSRRRRRQLWSNFGKFADTIHY